jgi:hypothetical protein
VASARTKPSSGDRCILFLFPRQATENAMALDIVMPALVAGIHVLWGVMNKDVDGRNKSGHDARVVRSKYDML